MTPEAKAVAAVRTLAMARFEEQTSGVAWSDLNETARNAWLEDAADEVLSQAKAVAS